MKKYKNLIGKTIKNIVWKQIDNDEIIIIIFTDNTKLTIKSWDYESYKSGLNINIK